MTVYTIFAFGTGESSKMKKQNIISRFSQACSSEKLILEGPGPLGIEVKKNLERAVKQIVEWLEASDDDENTINITGFSRGAVTATRIAYFINMLANNQEEARVKYPELMEKITNNPQLLDRLKKARFNIFAMDPVAGMVNKGDQDARVISGNVDNYVATLQVDELRKDFATQDRSRVVIETSSIFKAGEMSRHHSGYLATEERVFDTDSSDSSRDFSSDSSSSYDSDSTEISVSEGSYSRKTNVTFLPFPGNHSDGTKVKSSDMKDLTEVYWLAMYRFLTSNGSAFQDNKIPALIDKKNAELSFTGEPNLEVIDPKLLLTRFAAMHDSKSYKESGARIKLADGLPIARTKRGFTKHLEDYVLDSGFFFNQLEREAMKLAYPKIFNYFFERNTYDENNPENTRSTE